MTETVKTYICSYNEKNSDKILNSDHYWDDIHSDNDVEKHYLYKDSAYLDLYSVPNKHRECVEMNSKNGIMVVYTYKDSDFCDSIIQYFRNIHNVNISVYAPTYTEHCSLLRCADELTAYGRNPQTSDIEEISEQVIDGENLPVTKAKLEWNESFELYVTVSDQKFKIKTNESDIENFHTTKEYKKFIDVVTTHFSL